MRSNLYERIARVLSRKWHNLRYLEYRNDDVLVKPAVGDSTDAVQEALDYVVSTSTGEYQIYLSAKAVYDAKWYRWFINKPIWIDGGTVTLEAGLYDVRTLDIKSNTTLRGSGFDTIVKSIEPDREKPAIRLQP